MKILIIGDVVRNEGREAIASYIGKVRNQYDFIIVNGENVAGGKGIMPKHAEEFFELGVNVITSGDHVWDQKDIYSYLENSKKILRPYNYPEGNPGVGYTIQSIKGDKKIAVVSLQGRVFMPPVVDCPFRTGLELVEKLRKETKFIIIDFHAEATSEKVALGKYLDGKVSVVFGTHTHVQTADEKILPEGTGYITDVGMTGSDNGIIGVASECVIPRFVTGLPAKFEGAVGNIRLNGIKVELDEETGECKSIERINIGEAEIKF